MVDLAMSIFEFLTKFLIFWQPWHPWICIRSDLKPLFETDISDSSYCDLGPLVPKPVIEQELFFAVSYSKLALQWLMRMRSLWLKQHFSCVEKV